MVIIDGVKYACTRCIRGHRVSGCSHTDQALTMIKPKGRPATHCAYCREMRRRGSGGSISAENGEIITGGGNKHCTCGGQGGGGSVSPPMVRTLPPVHLRTREERELVDSVTKPHQQSQSYHMAQHGTQNFPPHPYYMRSHYPPYNYYDQASTVAAGAADIASPPPGSLSEVESEIDEAEAALSEPLKPLVSPAKRGLTPLSPADALTPPTVTAILASGPLPTDLPPAMMSVSMAKNSTPTQLDSESAQYMMFPMPELSQLYS